MDSLNLSSTNRKRKADSLSLKNSFKKTRFYQSTLRQNWTFPDSIIFYITQNPSTSKLYQKLIQTCKFFFAKNPIILCSHLQFPGLRENDGNEKEKNENIWYIDQRGQISKRIDLTNFIAKLWIEDTVRIDESDSRNVISVIVPFIYQCDAYDVNFYHQDISLKEYMIFATNACQITFTKCIVKNDDGSIVEFEKLMVNSPTAISFTFDFAKNCTGISSETVENLFKNPQFLCFSKLLGSVTIRNVPEFFDIETFYTNIKEGKCRYISFYLSFADTISEEYKKRLEKIVEDIRETKHHRYIKPSITIPRN